MLCARRDEEADPDRLCGHLTHTQSRVLMIPAFGGASVFRAARGAQSTAGASCNMTPCELLRAYDIQRRVPTCRLRTTADAVYVTVRLRYRTQCEVGRVAKEGLRVSARNGRGDGGWRRGDADRRSSATRGQLHRWWCPAPRAAWRRPRGSAAGGCVGARGLWT